VSIGQETVECRGKDIAIEEFWGIIKPNSNEKRSEIRGRERNSAASAPRLNFPGFLY